MSNDTDRELLELAAKAAGYEVDRQASEYIWQELRQLALLNLQGGHTLWNPLTDDGDALRLMVDVRIDLIQFGNFARAEISGMSDVHEKHNGDPLAVTRRAIVRAAAELGRTL